jgi:ABC-type multidrug transport system ATPase subunit
MKLRVEIDEFNHKKTSPVFFSNCRFEIKSNGIYCLTGSSGIGKTTLLRILLGINNFQLKGTIEYEYLCKTFSPSEIRKKGCIGYLPQEQSLIPWLSIKDNLILPSKLNSLFVEPTLEIILNNFMDIGLEREKLFSFPHELSFGESSRVGLIRAILYQPKILFLDELFTGVDSYNNNLISKFLHNISNKTLIIFVSHNIE